METEAESRQIALVGVVVGFWEKKGDGEKKLLDTNNSAVTGSKGEDRRGHMGVNGDGKIIKGKTQTLLTGTDVNHTETCTNEHLLVVISQVAFTLFNGWHYPWEGAALPPPLTCGCPWRSPCGSGPHFCSWTPPCGGCTRQLSGNPDYPSESRGS